jgi:hypothetical protein
MLERPALQGRQHQFGVLQEKVGGPGQLDRQGSVVDVRRGHPLVQKARFRSDDFGDVGEKGDDVVLGLALDLVDAVDIEDRFAAARPDRFGRRSRNGSERGHGVSGVRLDLEHDAETCGRRPDGRRLGARVAIYHAPFLPPRAARRKTSGLLGIE